MYLIKTLSKKNLDAAINYGKIRIGTINYYRKIEDTQRQDGDEGLGKIVWEGEVLTAENHNKVFTPFDKVKLKDGLKISNKGAKLEGAYPNFNLFTFCFSQVENISEINSTAGGKATHYYFIVDLPYFIMKLTKEIKKIGEEMIRKYEPEKAEHIIQNLTVFDTTYKIFYSDEPKSRTVTEKNVDSFKPKQFFSQDFFQKRTSFSFEQEVRTVWFFIYSDENGLKQPLQIPHPDLEFVDLELGSLPISKNSIINDFPIKTSTPKPKEV